MESGQRIGACHRQARRVERQPFEVVQRRCTARVRQPVGGTAFGAVVGATLIQTVKLGLVFTGVNLYLQPILLGAIIFLAVLADGLRGQRLRARLRRTIRPVGAAG